MKYLSFITVLILLVTLFSFVFTQLNKDETKHEYGIAFPLEESESRLPPLSSVIQSESDAKASNSQPNVESLNEPTTTTETVGTSKTASTDQQPAAETPSIATDSNKSEEVPTEGEGGSIVIESLPDSGNTQNETDANKDSSEESNDQNGATNPKLVFIERLMGLNFQRAPGQAFSSFLDMRDSQNDNGDETNKNGTKTETTTSNDDEQGSKDAQPELPWGNTLDNLRSRWESRIRKFTFPFQNSYSVVLRASSISDPTSNEPSKEGESEPVADNSDNGEKIIKPVDVPSDAAQGNDGPVTKFFFQPASPLSPMGQQSPGPMGNGQNPQTNQLLRMAALSMMSKLFSALRNQAVYRDSKMDEAPSRFASSHSHDAHDLDLDDDDDDNESDDRVPEGGLPVPIIIAQRPKMNPDASPYGYGNEEPSMPPMRTAIMYGRPGPAAAQQGPIMMAQRFYGGNSPAPVSPLAAILAAAAARQRRMEAAAPQESQPQRVILLITRPREEAPVAPRVQFIARDEQPSYQAASPMFAQYAPLAAPSSPVYFHYSPQAAPQVMPQPRPQVVEVPVPMYMPMMMRMGRNAAVGPAPIRPRPTFAVPRMMPAEPRGPAPEPVSAQSGPGHVAVLYYHAPEAAESSPMHDNMPSPMAQPESPVDSDSPTGFVRIMLRPKMSPAPVASPMARMAFHRRLDDSDDEPQHSIAAPIIAAHPHPEAMIDGGSRLRQWRDYNQYARGAPAGSSAPAAPVAHLLIAAAPSAREDPEPASSEEHFQHFAHPQHPSPFFFHGHSDQESPAQQQPHPLMMATHQGAPYVPQAQQQSGPAGSPHAAFFIVADPHGAQQDANSNNNDA